MSHATPLPAEIQRLLGDVAADFARAGTRLYDLDCVPGARFLALDGRVPANMTFVGIGHARDQVAAQRARFAHVGLVHPHELIATDLNDAPDIRNTSVVILNLTPPCLATIPRAALLSCTAQGLTPGGCLVLLDTALPGSVETQHEVLLAHGFRTSEAFLRWNDLLGLVATA